MLALTCDWINDLVFHLSKLMEVELTCKNGVSESMHEIGVFGENRRTLLKWWFKIR